MPSRAALQDNQSRGGDTGRTMGALGANWDVVVGAGETTTTAQSRQAEAKENDREGPSLARIRFKIYVTFPRFRLYSLIKDISMRYDCDFGVTSSCHYRAAVAQTLGVMVVGGREKWRAGGNEKKWSVRRRPV